MDRIVARAGVALALLAAVAYAATTSLPAIGSLWDLVHLVITPTCVDTFLSGDLFNQACLKTTISKCLGYAIIAGACVVKLPQIIAYVKAGSVAGASFGATYLDLLGYLLQSGYHLVLGSPFSAYGETLIITVQSALLVLLLWRYQPPGAGHASVVTALLAAAAAVPFNLPPAYLLYVQLGTSVVFSVSRLLQIVAIARAGGIGNLSFVTLFMQFAGSAARIFTSSVEVKQVEVFYSFVVSTLLNGTLVAQWLYYTLAAGGGSSGKKEVAAAPVAAVAAAPAKPAAAKPAAAAAAPEEEAKAAPSSGKKGKATKKTQ